MDVWGEGISPDMCMIGSVEEYPSHSLAGGIRAPKDGRVVRDDLGKVGRALTEAGRKAGKVCHGVS